MTREYSVTVEGQVHTVVISDEKEALLAAKAAGTASVELWDSERGESLFLTKYAVEALEDIDQEYLEQVVRRHLGLPWEILRTRRLVIREFQPGDETKVPWEPEDREADEVFRKPEFLREYIRCQYGLYGYGIWAVIEKDTGRLIGKAGVFNLEWDWESNQGKGNLPVSEKEWLRKVLLGEGQLGKNEPGENELRKNELGKSESGKNESEKNESGETQPEKEWLEREAQDGLELGYHIFTPYRRKGYGEEACRGILEWCRGMKVYAKTDASNQASVNLLKKLGFNLIDQRCSESGQWRCLYVWNC